MNNENPVLSVITVTYNVFDTLENTIRSVKGQTFKNIEYIIIDGKSNDGTVDIIRNNENHISRWISEPDTGLYDAMNKGIGLAKGIYLLFLNAGDLFFSNDTLDRIFNSDNKSPDILYGETMIIDKDEKEIGLRRLKAPEKLTWKSLKKGMVVCHQSFIVKKNIAPKYDIGYKYSADIDWVIKCLRNARSITNTHLIISRFLDGGQSKTTIIPSLKERFKIMRKNYGLIPTLWHHLPIALRFFLFLFRNRRF